MPRPLLTAFSQATRAAKVLPFQPKEDLPFQALMELSGFLMRLAKSLPIVS